MTSTAVATAKFNNLQIFVCLILLLTSIGKCLESLPKILCRIHKKVVYCLYSFMF